MKIICVARNYAAHAKELNHKLPDEPVIFLKPESALIRNNKPFYLPDFSKEMHYEGELVLRINRLGKNIEPQFAHKYYDQVTTGIDFTARDLQKKAKEKGWPWEIAKAFDNSAVIGELMPLNKLPDINDIKFSLSLNGKKVQSATPSEMIFSIATIISHISRFFTLKIGDFIFTGTPVGVGTVKIDDLLEGYLMDDKVFELKIK